MERWIHHNTEWKDEFIMTLNGKKKKISSLQVRLRRQFVLALCILSSPVFTLMTNWLIPIGTSIMMVGAETWNTVQKWAMSTLCGRSEWSLKSNLSLVFTKSKQKKAAARGKEARGKAQKEERKVAPLIYYFNSFNNGFVYRKNQ